MARVSCAVPALLLVSLITPAARAESTFDAGGSLELLLTTKTSAFGQDTLTFSPLLHADAIRSSGWALAVEWGVAVTRVTTGAESLARVASGNPVVTVSKDLSGPLGSHLRLGLGAVIGVGLPSALEDARAARDALGYAAAARGLWSAWDWLPTRFGVVVPFTVDEVRRGDFGVAADGALAWVSRSPRAVPAAGTGAPDLFAQLGVDALAHLDPATFGARLQVVTFDTGSPSHAELAVAPFAKIAAGPVDIGARVLVPLAGPTAASAAWSAALVLAGRI